MKSYGMFNLLPNGLIQLELGSQQAVEQTLINGKRMDGPHQIVQHLDTIYFGQGAMLLFKYPMMKVKLLKYKEDIQVEVNDALEDDIDAPNPDEDEIEAMAWTRLMEKGIGTDEIPMLICNEETYSEENIKNDREAVDWESANEEVLKIQEEERLAQIEAAKEEERIKFEQLKKEQEEADRIKTEQLLREMALKEEQMRIAQEQKEKERQRKEEETRLELQKQLELQVQEL